ncbi:hypothetical protein BZM27_53575 [Paraburkholderia steynii]|uniref:Isochorismatase-like domain-containing protein n=1 Tax=Paraburkholderia steynii TaxID=1245441 RepID=A0A4R0WYI1_9BURK|nr:hypothetical protein BZM27_53575 [Paraburkholderia steynii]
MLVVDMQNDFVADGTPFHSAQAHAMVPRLAATLNACRNFGTRVVFTHMCIVATAATWGVSRTSTPPSPTRQR